MDILHFLRGLGDERSNGEDVRTRPNATMEGIRSDVLVRRRISIPLI